MTARKPAHAAPQITLYKPELGTWARHRKPNRRQLRAIAVSEAPRQPARVRAGS